MVYTKNLVAVCAGRDAVRAAAQSPKRCAAFAALPLVFFTIHATYGVGTCAGIVRGLFDKLRGQ